MFSKPLAYPSTLDRRSLGQIVVLRGGVLEPDFCLPAGKAQAKADAYSPMAFPSAAAEIFLSQAGPRFDLELLKLSITFCLDLVWSPFQRKKATRFGSPSSGSLCG
jgi:hypothetical protein